VRDLQVLPQITIVLNLQATSWWTIKIVGKDKNQTLMTESARYLFGNNLHLIEWKKPSVLGSEIRFLKSPKRKDVNKKTGILLSFSFDSGFSAQL